MQLGFPSVYVQDKHTSRRASSSCDILSSSAAAAAVVLRFLGEERGDVACIGSSIASHRHRLVGDAIRGPKFSRPVRSQMFCFLGTRQRGRGQSLEFPHYFFSRSPFLNFLSFSSSRKESLKPSKPPLSKNNICECEYQRNVALPPTPKYASCQCSTYKSFSRVQVFQTITSQNG
jgi:hypothetical protein